MKFEKKHVSFSHIIYSKVCPNLFFDLVTWLLLVAMLYLLTFELIVDCSRLTIGVRLLRKMGWKEGQGVGPRMSRQQKQGQACLYLKAVFLSILIYIILLFIISLIGFIKNLSEMKTNDGYF